MYCKTKRVIWFVILAVQACESAESSISCINYDRSGNLCMSVGNRVVRAGTGKVVTRENKSITAFAFSPTSGDVRTSVEDNMYLRFFPDGQLLEIEQSGAFSTGYLGDEAFFAQPRASRVEAVGRAAVYPALIGNEPHAFFSTERLVVCGKPGVKAQNVVINFGRSKSCKDLAFAPGYAAALVLNEHTKAEFLRLYRLPQKYLQPGQELMRGHGQIEVSDCAHIELTPARTLIAASKGKSADLYSIRSPRVGKKDALVKKRTIETDAPVTKIASTPAGWMKCSKAALATGETVYEVDAKTGEPIASYNDRGQQISKNWWRTIRRNTLAVASGVASVAATLFAYRYCSQSKK